MKTTAKLFWYRLLSVLVLSTTQLLLWAQDNSGSSSSSSSSQTTTTTATDSTNAWYTQPWVWIVGAAVLILLIIALSTGRRSATGSSDKVTVTKTVTRDTGSDV